MARPTSHSQALADDICTRLAGGESLRAICRDESYPHISTILLWVVQDREGFSEQYMQAREAAGFAHADRVADIALMASEEGIDPQAARAAMDGLKWAAERMSPKRHSQRQEIDHTTKGESMNRGKTLEDFYADEDVPPQSSS